jgi:hypothetical protein
MQATSRALDYLLRAVGDPLAELGQIGPSHPEFHRAQVIRAGAGVLAKTPDAFPIVAEAIRTADARGLAPNARAHLHAARAWLSGNPVEASERYASILGTWPRDLLALRLAQSSYFFLGWHERMCAVVDAVMRAWPRDADDFGFVLAMASFMYAERGDAEYAEALGRQALTHDRACPLGVHSVAHAIAESARPHHGAQWMREQHAQWARESRLRTHNAWHLAMFDVADGNVQSALGILDAWLLPASAQSALDACDAAALLWQLEREGVDCGARWHQVSDGFTRMLVPGFWPFVDLHAALAHLRAGRHAQTQALMRAIERSAHGSDFAALRARHITLPGLRALVAWGEGRYDEAVDLFDAVLPVLDEAGGSRVQLELFDSIQHEARRRAGRGTPVERVRPRPKVKLIEAMMQAARERVSSDETAVAQGKLIYDTQKG